MSYDLEFALIAAREIQYDARKSVPDFEQEMKTYTALAVEAKKRCSGILDIQYGSGRAERLDIYPAHAAAQPSPLFVFIHGGYWHSQTKEDAGSMITAFVEHGVAIAVIEYTLEPESTLPEIVREVRSAISWLHANASHYGFDPDRLYVGGSSAGGHLAGMLACDGWQSAYNLPADAVKGVLCMSGLYDLRPLCDISVNTWLRLTKKQAELMSPALLQPRAGVNMVFSVGGKEVLGFKHQAFMMHDTWTKLGVSATFVEDIENNHFSLVNELSKPGSPLFTETIKMIESR